ncbi:hypothetical protein, partial [Neisseria sp. oral taxon 020]|uniref:hypothetical protein n=1 Tax=Neisseria sp. oral taxon 020 TaxID=712401 RepID=UPI0018DE5F4F
FSQAGKTEKIKQICHVNVRKGNFVQPRETKSAGRLKKRGLFRAATIRGFVIFDFERPSENEQTRRFPDDAAVFGH